MKRRVSANDLKKRVAKEAVLHTIVQHFSQCCILAGLQATWKHALASPTSLRHHRSP